MWSLLSGYFFHSIPLLPLPSIWFLFCFSHSGGWVKMSCSLCSFGTDAVYFYYFRGYTYIFSVHSQLNIFVIKPEGIHCCLLCLSRTGLFMYFTTYWSPITPSYCYTVLISLLKNTKTFLLINHIYLVCLINFCGYSSFMFIAFFLNSFFFLQKYIL